METSRLEGRVKAMKNQVRLLKKFNESDRREIKRRNGEIKEIETRLVKIHHQQKKEAALIESEEETKRLNVISAIHETEADAIIETLRGL